ncbi:hypothetical protein R1flu_022538 [Riccia fluitans]|uniref:Uncharacterized protein n=1 Tax=Riccia fluitans TaxID=41844 RepID=A0ABD1XSD4_9MARC
MDCNSLKRMARRIGEHRAQEASSEREVSPEPRRRRRLTVAEMNDTSRKLYWSYLRTDNIRAVVHEVDMEEVERLDFLYALGKEYYHPHIKMCHRTTHDLHEI